MVAGLGSGSEAGPAKGGMMLHDDKDLRRKRNQMLKALEELGTVDPATLTPEDREAYRKNVALHLRTLLWHIPAVFNCTGTGEQIRYCLTRVEAEMLARSTGSVSELERVLSGEAPIDTQPRRGTVQ